MSRRPTGLSRRRFLGGAAAAALLGTLPARRSVGARPDRRPNFLYVFPDQLRVQALGIGGETNIATPIFDALAASGAWFPRCYTSNPRCTPARSTLMTGLYPSYTGVKRNEGSLGPRWPTLPKRLGAAGYRCGFIGKWHLSGRKNQWIPPKDRAGFDDYWAAHCQEHRYFDSRYWTNSPTALRPDPPDRWEPEYQTDLALGFMERFREEPWLLMLGYGPPHPPQKEPVWDWSVGVPQEDLARVDAEALKLRPNVPGWIQRKNRGADGKSEENPGARHYLQGYYAAVLGIERVIGRLLRGLETLGLAEDTLVVFTSDHGDLAGSHGRFRKGQYYEEAVRVPLAMRWPGRIPPGRVLDFPVGLADVLPTLLALGGATPPPLLHGADLSGWLLGEPGPEPELAYAQGDLFKPGQGWDLAASREWKLVAWESGEVRLFHLSEDPYELEDLAAQPRARGVRAELERRLADWRDRVRRKPR